MKSVTVNNTGDRKSDVHRVPKNLSHLMFDNNIGKCGPIFKLLSPGDSWENSLCMYQKHFHLTFGSRWYSRPAAGPAAVRLECRRPFGLLSEAVRTHNPIASWTPLVESSGASHIPAVRSGLPLSSWNSAGVPCWEPAPDIWRRHSTSSALCWLSHAGGTVH